MKRALILFSILMVAPAAAQDTGDCCGARTVKPWAPYNKFVRWEASPDAAYRKSKEDGKLVLLFDLVGNLDKEGC